MNTPEFEAKLAEFNPRLKALLAEYNFAFGVYAIFTDKLGNKHVMPDGGAITAELKVGELPAKEQENGESKPNDGGAEAAS